MARREFLREASSIAAAALVALGVAPARAAALPIEMIGASRERRRSPSYPIPTVDGVIIDKSNDTIITRWQGRVYAFNLACPHQNTAIKWSNKEGHFECPKHHSRFSPDGSYAAGSGRATRALDRFDIRKAGEEVVVDLDKLYQEAEDALEWQRAFVSV